MFKSLTKPTAKQQTEEHNVTLKIIKLFGQVYEDCQVQVGWKNGPST